MSGRVIGVATALVVVVIAVALALMPSGSSAPSSPGTSSGGSLGTTGGSATASATGSGAASATPGGGVGATGPVAARACTGNWNASLRRSEETMVPNGFTQADVIFDAPLEGIPQFELVGEPTIEAEQFLNANPDPVDPGEWDLFIDRRGDTPFPTGTHQLTLRISVIGETCEIPLTLVVS